MNESIKAIGWGQIWTIVLKLLFPALSIHPAFLSEVRISFAIPWAGLPVILYGLQLWALWVLPGKCQFLFDFLPNTSINYMMLSGQDLISIQYEPEKRTPLGRILEMPCTFVNAWPCQGVRQPWALLERDCSRGGSQGTLLPELSPDSL